jgi:ABC-type lipoprotein release transport system permease subunit
MTAVWLVIRAGLRARWRSWLALALVAGVMGGLVSAVAAGARRTDAAYPALVAWSQPPDDLVALNFGPDFAAVPAATAARLPQVTGAGSLTSYTALEPASVTVYAPADSVLPGTLWHRKLLAGQLPDPAAADQADISFTVAQAEHLGVGGTLSLVLLGADGKPARFTFQVVGIDAAPSEFPPQFGTGFDPVWATPAFTRAHGRAFQATSAVALRLRHGAADVPALEDELTRLSGGKVVSDFPLDPQAVNTERSIHWQGTALWLLAGLLTLLGLLILAQLIARLTTVESSDYGALRSVGMSPAQLTTAGLARAALIGAVGGLIAVAVALAASPAFPVGLAGIAEPHPGFAADWTALGLGLLGVAVATCGCAAWPARRAAVAGPAGPYRGAAGAAPAGTRAVAALLTRPVTLVLGTRLALHRGTGPTAVPVRTTVGAAAVGIAGLSAALVFAASLVNLLASPRLYGLQWDAFVANVQNASMTAAAASVARDPQVAHWTGTYMAVPIQVNGVRVDAVTTGPGPDGSLVAVPLAGQTPQGPDDIVLGARTLAAAGARIGDTVRVSVSGMPGGATRRVVGTAVFPAMSDNAELGTGAELTLDGLVGMAPPGVTPPPYSALMVTFRPGAGPQRDITALGNRLAALGPYAVSGAATPADLVNFGQVQDLPLLVGLALGAAALLTIAHLLLTAVRRRRRDLAVLRVLGLTGRQVRATVSWMAVTVTLAALAAGVPVGAACGRLAWEFFAGQLGVQPVTEVPPVPVVILVASGLVLAVAVAALPGARASRARPAAILRAE